MYFKVIEETDCLKFSNLAACQGIAHGVFTRYGGNREDSNGDLNVSSKTGDDIERVMDNRARINNCLKSTRLFFVNQVHGTAVTVLKDNIPRDIDSKTLPCADAVVSNIPGLDLLIMTADCQAVLLFDPAIRVCANIHSGWRGSIENIIAKTVDIMKDRFSTDPANLVAGIAPSLGPCCAEFVNFKKEIPNRFWNYRCAKDRHGQDPLNYFDFWAISRAQLADAGLKPENIETGGICTKCNPHLFFSYRESGTLGRFANIIGIRAN